MKKNCCILLWIFCFGLSITLGAREDKSLGNVVTTLQKAGTNLMIPLMRELDVRVPVAHFILETKETQGITEDALLRLPEDFKGKTVIVIRDLYDVMPSMLFWLEKIMKDILNDPPPGYPEGALEEIRTFLGYSFDEKLLTLISLDPSIECCHNTMVTIQNACELILALKRIKSPDEIKIVTFEEIIGAESGGRLSEMERVLLVQQICTFLGYPRTYKQVLAALTHVFGKGVTYNPIKTKVGRGKPLFNAQHHAAFDQYWKPYNIALGYQQEDI